MAIAPTVIVLALVCYFAGDVRAAPSGSSQCPCPVGFTGDDCTEVIDNCASGPCQNGGSCINSLNSYMCACPPGYTNKECQTLIDNCASGPCAHTTSCTNGVNTYTCACQAGWTGINCDSQIDSCETAPCLNNGTCINGVNTFTCSCPVGYTDPTCGTIIDNCNPNPCRNGATCSNDVNDYSCTCAPGYTGAKCESVIDNCWSGPCLNGGQCINAVNKYVCVCEPGFTGENCGDVVDNCEGKCLNGASCTNGVNSFTCQCAPGYMGNTCCRPDPCYFSNPCKNGGSCITTDEGYNCTCMAHWLGPNCDILKGFSYRACADDFVAIYADGVKLGSTRAINVTAATPIPDGTKVLAVRGQNTFKGAGWKGIADDGRYPSDASWRCTDKPQVGFSWTTSKFDDSSWHAPATKLNYNWMCPTYPSSSYWLWTDAKYSFLGTIYCRLVLQKSEDASPICAPNCLSCTVAGAKKCDVDSCDVGYGLNDEGTCDKCTDHCRKCDANGGGNCDKNECTYGFAFNANTLKCDSIIFTACSDDNIWLYADGIYQACENVNSMKDMAVTFVVPPGTKVIATKTQNKVGNTGGWKGFLSGGGKILGVTNDSWKCTSKEPVDDSSWRQADFDDSDWDQAYTSDDIKTFTNEKPPKPGCVIGYPPRAKFIWAEPTFSEPITVYCRKRLRN